MFRKPVFLLLALIFISSNCEKPIAAKLVYSFWVKNTSGAAVSFHVGQAYPDTNISGEFKERLYTVSPGDSIAYNQDEEWEEYFADLPKDTLSVFFFDPDTIAKYSNEEIRSEYKVIERRDFGLEYLRSRNYRLIYP